jgi:tetratricopeptide (TPR) repeat protein
MIKFRQAVADESFPKSKLAAAGFALSVLLSFATSAEAMVGVSASNTQAGSADADRPRLPHSTVSEGKTPALSERLDAALNFTHNNAWEKSFALGKEKLAQGYYAEAQTNLLNAIRDLKRTKTVDSSLIRARNWLGQAYLRDGKYVDANEAFTLAEQLAKQLNLTNDALYAGTLEGMALVCKQTDQMKKAERLFKQAIEIRRNVGNGEGERLAQTILELAQVYSDQQLFDQARPLYELALQVLDRSPNVPDLTKSYYLDKVGAFFAEQGKMPQAKECYGASLELKDKYGVTYAPVDLDARKRGLVYYPCAEGAPNCAHVFTRGIEIESMHVKDMVAASTLTAEVYGPDWYLMKAEVTIQNQGKAAISALAEQPTLEIESSKKRLLLPLDSDAIARELGFRGRQLFNRLLYSADYDCLLHSVTMGNARMVAHSPNARLVLNTRESGATFAPDWECRAAAHERAFALLASTMSEEATVINTKPCETTIAPGASTTFLIYFPYNRFEKATLRCLFGNTVLEFPFTSKSG